MNELYVKKNLNCFNFERNIHPTLEIYRKQKDEIEHKDFYEVTLAYALEGSILFSYGSYIDEALNAGELLIFVPGTHVRMKAAEDSFLLFFQLKGTTKLCDCVTVEMFFSINQKEPPHIPKTIAKKPIVDFFTGFIERMNDGLKCLYYLEVKIKELLFLLRGYYSRDELVYMFSPLTGNDALFSLFVYQNFNSVSNVQQLIAKSPYSMSGFKKKFARVFGEPPAVWMKKQKAKNIFHDLHSSDLTIKEICFKYDFSSISGLNNFCKQQFGNPPGRIRQEKQRVF